MGGTLGASASPEIVHTALLAGAGLLMILFPPRVALPRTWYLLAGLFALGGLAAFLPAAWFGKPPWRIHLEEIGVGTGNQIAIQASQAGETLLLFLAILATGLWLAGHRSSSRQLRVWSLLFVIGVATYALLAQGGQVLLKAGGQTAAFGFFPNRNHTATYLAMGSLCGLGCLAQAVRDRSNWRIILSALGGGICLWATFGWSVSRAGVLLVALASPAWLFMVGRQNLGTQVSRAIAILTVAAVGLFLIFDTQAKARLSRTLDAVDSLSSQPLEEKSNTTGAAPSVERFGDLDFRIPTWLDTFDLIRDSPWTGVGAGQFRHVFPQYRTRTAIANASLSAHPESDWLWMASETGVLSTLSLALLAAMAAWKSIRNARSGRERALRTACVVAALIVPIHGLFDVPGHRAALAAASFFLFCLALPPGEGLKPPHAAAWFFRVVGVFMIAGSAYVGWFLWAGGSAPAVLAAKVAKSAAVELDNQDYALIQAARNSPSPATPPAHGDELLEQASRILTDAIRQAPLDRDLRHMQGGIALKFDDQENRVDRSFAIELALDPTWIEVPLRQARAWSSIDTDRTRALWIIALQRADALDRRPSETGKFRSGTLGKIRQTARGNSTLEQIARGLGDTESN